MNVPFQILCLSRSRVQKQRDHRNLFHFAMRLRPEFEALYSSILHHHHPLPSLTKAVTEFTYEEIHLQMLSSLSALVQSESSPIALAAPYHPPTSHGLPFRGPFVCGQMN